MAKAKPITGLDPHAPTQKNARLIAAERLAEMYDWEDYVADPRNAQELHNMRISAKRLRYTLEIFEDVLPEECKAIVKEVERIQEELGSLHDSDVKIVLLRLCLGKQQSAMLEQEGNTRGQKRDRPLLRPDLVSDVVDPAVAPSVQERAGLEALLRKQHRIREEQYLAFRLHWTELQGRGFQQQVLTILAS